MKVNMHRFFQGKSYQLSRPVTTGHGHHFILLRFKSPSPSIFLKGQQREMFLVYSVPLLAWMEWIQKYFELCLLLTKEECHFTHLALQESAPNGLVPPLLLCTMQFFLQARPKRKAQMRSSVATGSSRNFFNDFLFSFTGSFQSCIFFPRRGTIFPRSPRTTRNEKKFQLGPKKFFFLLQFWTLNMTQYQFFEN